jgi:hypothetical protein
LLPELVEQIFIQLGDMVCRLLSQVSFLCRAFRGRSLAAFGTEFFECPVAILHPLSLAILLEIATRPTLSRTQITRTCPDKTIFGPENRTNRAMGVTMACLKEAKIAKKWNYTSRLVYTMITIHRPTTSIRTRLNGKATSPRRSPQPTSQSKSLLPGLWKSFIRHAI